MNIRKINLNLLITLDALLTERNVSRAAEKVFITQPAMSNSLNQLRELFKDQLLVRSGKKMELTAFAVEISPKIKNILQQIEDTVLHPQTFSPETTKRTFNIGMSDYGEFVILPELTERLAKLAPNITLRIIHLNTMNDPGVFVDGRIDLGIGITQLESATIHVEKLFTEGAICVARTDHIAIKKLNQKNYLAAKHLAIAYESEASTAITDQTLNESGLKRNVVLKVPHILAGMYILSKTQLLGTVPKRVALALQKPLKLSIHKPPFAIPDVTVSQAWHKRFADDKAHQWLRMLIKTVTKELA